MASNPIARKQLYRANAIRRLPTLKFVDGREVTYEERERVELMFVTDTRTMPHSLFYVDNQQHSQMANMNLGYGHNYQSNSTSTNASAGPRMPVKLTSVNFESLTGFSRNGSALATAAAAAASTKKYHATDGLLPSVTNSSRLNSFGRRTNAGSLMVNPSNAYQARRPDALPQPLMHRQAQSSNSGRSNHVWRINRG